MTFKEKVKQLLHEQQKTSFSIKQLFELFGINNKSPLGQELIKTMDSLCADGDMTFDEKTKKYKF